MFALLAFSLLFSHRPGLAARNPTNLHPNHPWVMQYEDDSCRLIRSFGAGNEAVVLTLSRYGPGDDFNLAIAGEPVRLRRNNAPLRLQFGEYEKQQKLRYFSGTFGERPALIGKNSLRISPLTKAEKSLLNKRKSKWDEAKLSPIAKQRYKLAEHLKISRQSRFSIILETGPLDKPFAAMDKCVDEMMAQWGIDTEKHKTLSQQVKLIGKPPRIVYPSDMLWRGQAAILQFRLSVNSIGKASDCHIQKTTRPREFDDAVCNKLVRLAKFEPALDANGEPIASYWRSTVVFDIPEYRKSGGP